MCICLFDLRMLRIFKISYFNFNIVLFNFFFYGPLPTPMVNHVNIIILNLATLNFKLANFLIYSELVAIVAPPFINQITLNFNLIRSKFNFIKV